MRHDVVPGAIFPDYELSDHTAKRRKLSELQEQHPMVLVLSRGGFCPKDRRQLKASLSFIARSRLAIAGLSRSVPTISLRRMNIAAELVPTGPSSPTRGVSCRKISTSLNTPTHSTIP